MSGKAVDFNLPDVSMATVRDIGLRLQSGGVGYYPRANNPWVHLDTGGVRHWPKVTREHLVRLFPDERTVHIPRDGKPLAGFETARAIIEARGGSVSSGYIDIAEGRATGRTLFQILFGGGEDEDVAPRGRGGRMAVAGRGRNTQVAALPQEAATEGNALAFMSQSNNSTSVAARQEAPALRPSRPTRPTPVEDPPAAPPPEAKPAEPAKPVEPKPVEVAAATPPRGAAPPGVRSDADDDGKRVTVQLPPRRPANFAELIAAASGSLRWSPCSCRRRVLRLLSPPIRRPRQPDGPNLRFRSPPSENPVTVQLPPGRPQALAPASGVASVGLGANRCRLRPPPSRPSRHRRPAASSPPLLPSRRRPVRPLPRPKARTGRGSRA